MRSAWKMPGNPWPHDMVIQTSTPVHLLTLLYVRHAWGIAADADVPALDPVPETGMSAPPPDATRQEWASRWMHAWERAWAWFEIEDVRHHPPTPELLRSLAPGSPLNPSVPPLWQVDHGPAGIDAPALTAWETSLRDDHSIPARQTPEWRNLKALIAAWRSGVESIILLPYHGYYARRVTVRHLAVSKTTRDDPELYARALRDLR